MKKVFLFVIFFAMIYIQNIFANHHTKNKLLNAYYTVTESEKDHSLSATREQASIIFWHMRCSLQRYFLNTDGGKVVVNDNENRSVHIKGKNNRILLAVGIAPTSPRLFTADASMDDGKFRLQLSREDIPVTPRLRLNLMINTDKEYMAGVRYTATNSISFAMHYDSDRGMGAGLTFTY